MSVRPGKPSHPGEILKQHYLVPRGITQKSFFKIIKVSEKYLSQLINGRKRLEPDVAERIAEALETTTDFWLNLQTAVDAWNDEKNR